MLAHNQNSLIGAPVIHNRTLERGHIVAIRAAETSQFLIGGGGLERVGATLTICFESRKVEIPDAMARPWIEAAKAEGLPFCDDVAALIAKAEAETAAAHDRARRASDERTARAAAHRAEFAKRCPPWAKAVIYAVLETDESDSMTDYFGSRIERRVIIGFSRHTRDLFPEMRAAASTFPETAHLATASDKAEHREKWSMGGGYYLKDGFRYSTGWKVQKRTIYTPGTPPDDSAEFYNPPPPVPTETAAPAPAATASGMTIEQHTHTKKGFEMFICIMAERVDRATFERLRSDAEAMGGWYSRPWGRTPGGFAFKDRATAEAFTGGSPAPVPAETATAETTAALAPVAATAAPRSGETIADKLEQLADSFQPDIDAAFRDRLENTPKRAKQGAQARLEGERLKRAQQGARALATAHRAGTVPPVLATVATKKALYGLAASKIDHSRGGYYDAGICTGKPYHETPDALAFWAMLKGKTPEEVKAEELRDAVAKLQFANIASYFPTPAALVARMLERADISDECNVLEPSAGSGNICDAVKAAHPGADVVAIEINPRLAEILRMKGHDVMQADFMEACQFSYFDRVVMNPPFERGQDIEHVRKAFDWLKPGGRLVAIMSPGPFYRSDRKAEEFRAWFDDLGGEREDIPAGAFKASGTDVATVLVEIRKG